MTIDNVLPLSEECVSIKHTLVGWEKPTRNSISETLLQVLFTVKSYSILTWQLPKSSGWNLQLSKVLAHTFCFWKKFQSQDTCVVSIETCPYEPLLARSHALHYMRQLCAAKRQKRRAAPWKRWLKLHTHSTATTVNTYSVSVTIWCYPPIRNISRHRAQHRPPEGQEAATIPQSK